jgi:hypothetical protein
MTDWDDIPDLDDLDIPDLEIPSPHDLGIEAADAAGDVGDAAGTAAEAAELGLGDAFGGDDLELDDLDDLDVDDLAPGPIEPRFGSSYHTDFWGNEWKTYGDGHVEKLN